MTSLNPSTSVCRVCLIRSSRYQCPRCSLAYCSVVCYKTHGSKCTEAFFQSQVKGAMKNMSVNEQQKLAMLRLLERCASQREEEESEADHQGLVERLQTLALNNTLTPEHLSEEQRLEFVNDAKSGKLSHLVCPYKPWWLYDGAHDVAVIVSDFTDWQRYIPKPCLVHEVEGDKKRIGWPSPMTKVELKREFNAAIIFDLFECILGYTLLLRLYNGDWSWALEDAAVELAQQIPAFSTRIHCAYDMSAVVTDVSENFPIKITLVALADAASIVFIDTQALVCALSDIQRLYCGAIRSLRGRCRTLVLLASKKASLFVQLAHHLPEQQRVRLATDAATEFERQCSELDMDAEIDVQRQSRQRDCHLHVNA